MSLLIVGNPGSFSSNITNTLSKDYNLELLKIDKSLNFSKNLLEVKNKLYSKIYKFLIYLGGETRDEQFMKEYNQYLLIEISNLCNKYKIHLIYLSSLAVFGIPKSNLITQHSLRDPYNLYGITKNEADIFLMKNSNENHVFNLIPASIKNNSKKNFFNQLKILVQKPYLKLIFFFFCPGGQFSFCSYDDISKEILNSIKFINYYDPIYEFNKTYYHEKIVSKGILFKDIYYEGNNFYPIFTLPSFNLKFIKYFLKFLNQKILLRIIFLFSIINYRNESL
tara:strand:+ start:781 stop:1620 length:840 start_codon:yes stop_codon:yes gene_type:complete